MRSLLTAWLPPSGRTETQGPTKWASGLKLRGPQSGFPSEKRPPETPGAVPGLSRRVEMKTAPATGGGKKRGCRRQLSENQPDETEFME